MDTENFQKILMDLKEERNEATKKFNNYINSLDKLIENAEALLALDTNGNLPKKSQNSPQKVEIDEVVKALQESGEKLRASEISEKISHHRGENVSAIMVSMRISWYLRSHKRGLKIKKFPRGLYGLKG